MTLNPQPLYVHIQLDARNGKKTSEPNTTFRPVGTPPKLQLVPSRTENGNGTRSVRVCSGDCSSAAHSMDNTASEINVPEFRISLPTDTSVAPPRRLQNCPSGALR